MLLDSYRDVWLKLTIFTTTKPWVSVGLSDLENSNFSAVSFFLSCKKEHENVWIGC